MQETWVLSLGGEDPLEKGMTTHSNILVWKIPWTEEPRGLQSMGLHRVGHDLATKKQLINNGVLISGTEQNGPWEEPSNVPLQPRL